MNDERIKARLLRWKRDPIQFVRDEFHVEPDQWQAEVLAAFPIHNRLAMKACKGPGKTAVLAWCVLNFLATRSHAKIGCTAITGDNLSTNLWSELAKWMGRSQYLSAMFTWTASKVLSKHYPGDWFAVARAWPKKANAEEQAHALAGLHADHAMFVLDESSEIPQAVMATAEAVLGSGNDTKVVQSGNPTRLDGPLYRACSQDRALWHVTTITGDPKSPKRSPRVNIDWATQQIETYGRDNPWVMVNVLGEFPPSSINALLGPEEVEIAMRRRLRPELYDWAQKRLGVDVARFGDDRTVIFPRQGNAAFKPRIMRNVPTTDIAAAVAGAQDKWNAELILVDDTGHWGHGVIDNLHTAGRSAIPVVFSDRAISSRYKNRRAEMWLSMAEWVKKGGMLPNIPELVGELITPTYSFSGGQFLLEEKDQIKARLGRSPDLADALAITFAIPDMPADAMSYVPSARRGIGKALTDFEPWADEG
jgi:hypothetical protein